MKIDDDIEDNQVWLCVSRKKREEGREGGKY